MTLGATGLQIVPLLDGENLYVISQYHEQMVFCKPYVQRIPDIRAGDYCFQIDLTLFPFLAKPAADRLVVELETDVGQCYA